MAIKKIKPLSPEISIGRTVGDNAVARIGHINNLVDQINGDFSGSDMLEAYFIMGSKISSVSLVVHTNSNINSGNVLTSGTGVFTAAYLPKDTNIAGVSWYQTIQGIVTTAGTNYNGVGVYSFNPLTGGLTLVASSTSDTTTTAGIGWKSAVGWAKTAFSAPVALSAGLYFIGAFYNVNTASTVPQIGIQTSAFAAGVNTVDFANSAKANSTLVFTTIPSTVLMSSTTAQAPQMGLWLYAN